MNRIRNLYGFYLIFQTESLELISPDYLQEKFEGILGIDVNTLVDNFTYNKDIKDNIDKISNRWKIDKNDNILSVYKFTLHMQKFGANPNQLIQYINKFISFNQISNSDTLKGRVHHLIIREIDKMDIENNDVFKILLRVSTIDDILFVD